MASNRPGGSVLRCVVIAGPNGAGKTTFARKYLLLENIIHFVNADLIAAGLSPLAPAGAALRAGRLMLSEIDRLSNERVSFAFESTLSGRRRGRTLSGVSSAVGIILSMYISHLSTNGLSTRIRAKCP